MRRNILLLPALCAGLCAAGPTLPVRGLHLNAPKSADVATVAKFIRDVLPKEGVNTLVMEFNYRYHFAKRPEVAEPDALDRDDVKQLVDACRDAGVRLIPQINLLGHQSWSKTTAALLRSHPEFDETPKKYLNNENIYCRSYCPLHPQVHDVVFDLIDEIVEACEADAFHAGMDEVFVLGDEDCPRCRGRLKAELFANEVRAIHDHLAKSGREMWMWGDRFLDGTTTGVGKWEGSFNETFPGIALAPKDVVICDWHYETAVPTAAHFAVQGYSVVSAPWRKPQVALGELDLIRSVRANGGEKISGRMLGVLQTTWCDSGTFVRAYTGKERQPRKNVAEAVECFRQLFRAIREQN